MSLVCALGQRVVQVCSRVCCAWGMIGCGSCIATVGMRLHGHVEGVGTPCCTCLRGVARCSPLSAVPRVALRAPTVPECQ